VRLIVDGSFVTTKEAPNDVDVIVLINELGLKGQHLPHQTWIIHRKHVNQLYSEEIDLQVASSDDVAAEWVDFFSQVNGAPGRRKGLLRVTVGANA
jgi:hypothetical protein